MLRGALVLVRWYVRLLRSVRRRLGQSRGSVELQLVVDFRDFNQWVLLRWTLIYLAMLLVPK